MMKLLTQTALVLAGFCLASNIAAQDSAPNPAATSAEPTQNGAAEEKTGSPSRGQDLVIVVGSGGTPEYEKQFFEWSERLVKAAERAGIASTLIGRQSPSAATPVVADSTAAKSDRDQLRTALADLSSHETSEPLWLIYLGHGTYDGRGAQLNLRGDDISEKQVAESLKSAKRPLAIVLCSSCSSPFINALSGPNRVIVTATKDGNQVQFARFGDAFSKAIDSLDADINRDGQSSLLEAWLFASRRTADFYKTEGRLATEHSLLDVNGDQRGTRAENFDGDRLKSGVKNAAEMDGRLATRWALVRSFDEKKLSPEQRARRDELEAQLETLRGRKESMDENEYLDKLESILRPLAELYDAGESSTPTEVPDKGLTAP